MDDLEFFDLVKSGDFKKILNEPITLRATLAESSIRWGKALASNLKEVPGKVLVSAGILRELSGTNITALHLAAMNGYLCNLPDDLLEQHMLHECKSVSAPLEVAARHQRLNQLPSTVLTAANLLKMGKRHTALHEAAIADSLSQIPNDVLTVENLLAADWLGITPLDLAGPDSLEYLLGLELEGSPYAGRFRDIVGEEWWRKNQEVISRKTGLGCEEQIQEVDLF